jgi:hypothetical protein
MRLELFHGNDFFGTLGTTLMSVLLFLATLSVLCPMNLAGSVQEGHAAELCRGLGCILGPVFETLRGVWQKAAAHRLGAFKILG